METFDPAILTDEILADTWELIERERGTADRSKVAASKAFIKRCCSAAATEYGTAHAEAAEAREPFAHVVETQPLDIDDPLVAAVEAALPAQPWKPGAHAEVASQLGVPPNRVSRAIATLIAIGRRNRQVDGVVFDDEGNVLAVDEDRVSSAEVPGARR